LIVPSPSLGLTFTPSGSLVLGSVINLICAAYKLFPGLTGYSTVRWILPSNSPSLNIISFTTPDDGNISLLRFYPLKSSHATNYTCQVFYFSPTGNITYNKKNFSVRAQSKIVKMVTFPKQLYLPIIIDKSLMTLNSVSKYKKLHW